MKKITFLFLVLAVTAIVNSRVVRRKKLNSKRQIFDTLDYNKGYNERLSPNQIIVKGYKKPATYLPPTQFVPSTYLPPAPEKVTTPRPVTPRPTPTRPVTPGPTPPRPTPPKPTPPRPISTPGSKYIVPTIGSTTQRTTFQTLRPIPPYTGTYPTYKFSTYNYTFTGTYPTTPYTFKPLVTVPTTPRPIGYVYTQPANNFEIEDLRRVGK